MQRHSCFYLEMFHTEYRCIFFLILSSLVMVTTARNKFRGKPCNETLKYQLHALGGANVEPGNFPFMVSFGMKDEAADKWKHTCGATILTESYLITAAHCCVALKNMKSQVLIGTTKLNEGGKVVKIKKTIIHEQYEDQHPAIEHGYDMCLLVAENPVLVDGKTTSKVSLPKIMPVWETSQHVTAMGWGITTPLVEADSHPMDLQFINNLRIMPNFECKAWERMLCTRPQELYGTCNGDSGGPLIFTGSNILIGLVSGGASPCAESDSPDMFTKVPFFTSWIKRKLGNETKSLKFEKSVLCDAES